MIIINGGLMDDTTRKKIKEMLKSVITSKLDSYSPETEYRPFFDAIFNRKQIVTHSILQSFYTTFGMSVYEQMAKILAEGAGFHAERQHILEGEIDSKTEALINKIHMQLKKGKKANKQNEIESIRKSIRKSKPSKDPDSVVDVFIRKPDGEEFYFDITTVKPNKKEFITLKKKLLRWVGLRLSQNKKVKVSTGVVIPYNPYHPKKYKRWTKGGFYDNEELIIGKEFWNFVADHDVYDELIEVFKEIGKELRKRIDGLTSA